MPSPKKQFVFDRLLLDAIRNGVVPQNTQQSVDWFYRRAGKVKDSTNRIFNEAKKSRKSNDVQVGDMLFFKYDAKGKGTLPYWDAVPLIIPFGETDKHFIAINLHYAPPKMRAKLFDMLLSIATDKKFDQQTKMMLTYDFLKTASRNKYFKPCIKRYLKSHVQSQFVKVHPSEWAMALFLPLQSFRKASSQKVYADYRKQVQRG